MKTVMEEAVTAVAAKRYTVRIAVVEVDAEGEVVEEINGCRLDFASTDIGKVDDIADVLIANGEECWGVLIEPETSTYRIMAEEDGWRQMQDIAAAEGRIIELECNKCQGDNVTLSPEDAEETTEAVLCELCGAVMTVVPQ